MSAHECPGGCGRPVAYERLACQTCWYALPPDLRHEVWRAYRQHGQGSSEHNEAVADALRWYRERVSS